MKIWEEVNFFVFLIRYLISYLKYKKIKCIVWTVIKKKRKKASWKNLFWHNNVIVSPEEYNVSYFWVFFEIMLIFISI